MRCLEFILKFIPNVEHLHDLDLIYMFKKIHLSVLWTRVASERKNSAMSCCLHFVAIEYYLLNYLSNYPLN